MRFGVIISVLIFLGAGCLQTSLITRCYGINDDADHSRISIAYDPTASEEAYNGMSLGVPATLTVAGATGEDPLLVTGYLRDGNRFVYPTGDYFEMVDNTLVGHAQTPHKDRDNLIEGIVATETECR